MSKKKIHADEYRVKPWYGGETKWTACGRRYFGYYNPQSPKIDISEKGDKVTCKRCLAILAKQAKLSTPAPAGKGQTQ